VDKISKARRRELPRKSNTLQLSVAPKYISVADALIRYSCHRQALYDRIATGVVVAVKDGNRTKIDVEATDRNYAALPSATAKVHLHTRARKRAEAKLSQQST
jgi:hypothetical protein